MGALYGAVDQFELAAAGGRNCDVGVGGFLLGGGMTFLSN
jgi:hypothetical protein